MRHTDLPGARLPSAVSPLRKLPLAEKSHLAEGHAPFPGQPFLSPQLGMGLSHLQMSPFGWLRPLLNLYHSPTSPSAQTCTLLFPSTVETPIAPPNKPPASSCPSHSLLCREPNLPSVSLDLFPSAIECPVSSWCKSSFPVQSAFEIIFKYLLIGKDLINSFLLRCNRPMNYNTWKFQFPPFQWLLYPSIPWGFCVLWSKALC